MNRTGTNIFLAVLSISAALYAGAANATDHRIWREQVVLPDDSVTELESKPIDPKKVNGNDSLLWREQVKVASKNRAFILERPPRSALTRQAILGCGENRSNLIQQKLS